jgi:hypothetical protein
VVELIEQGRDSLRCSGIDALIGQRVAAGMPEHVRMDFVASASKQLGEARRGEWATTLRSEHERRGRLALQLPQRPHFIAEEWMRRCLTALSPAHMQWSSIEFETGMKLLDMSDDIRAFIAANEALLKAKD